LSGKGGEGQKLPKNLTEQKLEARGRPTNFYVEAEKVNALLKRSRGKGIRVMPRGTVIRVGGWGWWGAKRVGGGRG